MQGRTKVALVGCGRHGRYHLDLLRSLAEELELVAVCERDRGRLSDARRAAGPGVFATRSIDELLRETRPDFAIVALMSHVGPPMCQKILEAGVAVLSEVPPAYAGPLARKMIDAARKNALPLAAFEQYVCTPIEQLKQELIRRGMLGAIESVRIGGSVGHKGHEIAVARSYIGYDSAPLRIRAHGYGMLTRRDVEGARAPAVLAGEAEFESGARAHFLLSGRGPNAPAVPVAGVDRDVRGSLGGFRNDRFFAWREDDSSQQTELELTARLKEVDGVDTIQELTLHSRPPVSWRNPFANRALPPAEQLPSHPFVDDRPRAWETAGAALILNMAEALRGDAELAYPVDRSMLDVRIRLAMLESAKRGGDWIRWQTEPFAIERKISSFRLYRFLKSLDRRALPRVERTT